MRLEPATMELTSELQTIALWSITGLGLSEKLAIRRSLNAGTETQAQAILREAAQSSDHGHHRRDHCGRRVAGYRGEDEAAGRWFHQADRHDDRPDRVLHHR